MAQVMDFGTFADARTLERAAGPDALDDVIRHAEPGWFSPAVLAFLAPASRLSRMLGCG